MRQSSTETLRSFFGETGVATIGQMEANLPELAKLVDNFVLDKVWSRKGLAPREKSLITISSQVAQGDWHQVETHMKSFLHFGGNNRGIIRGAATPDSLLRFPRCVLRLPCSPGN
jgi:alkylhydroperoxidase/carboxymuconolactone decarboxylase family protein YurZ